MDNWQKDCIRDNLFDLIGDIRCNILLLAYLESDGAIGIADRNEIETHGSNEHAKSRVLLDILQTREYGYQKLAKALYNCKQTGALITLLYGVTDHNENLNAFEYCGIHLQVNEVLKWNVNFGGKVLPLESVCKFIDAKRLKLLISSRMNVTMYQESLSGQNTPESCSTIMIDTIPKSISYYIPRSVTLRTQLLETVLGANHGIFVVEGIELYELTRLVRKHAEKSIRHDAYPLLTDTSSRQLNSPRISTRFILLEFPGHFDRLASIVTQPVHWIKYVQVLSENSFELHHFKTRNTTGFGDLRKYFLDTKGEPIPQSEFISLFMSPSKLDAVLLYDSPGMGKSVFLSEVAKKIKNSDPANVVIFLNSNQFTKSFEHWETDDEKYEQFCRTIIKSVSKNTFGESLLTEIFFAQSRRIFLFIDGFDELGCIEQNKFKQIFSAIKTKGENIMVCVATRPHFSDQLEDMLGVVGYNILPFQYADQVAFLLDYWQQYHRIDPTSLVKDFAQNCIEKVLSVTSSAEKEITGIPLQCQMLADIYAIDANLCLDVNPSSSSHVVPETRISSLFEMYCKFFDLKFRIFKSQEEKTMYKKIHVKAALDMIFNAKCDFMQLNVNPVVLCKIGIMEKRNGTFEFVHRTFAEYLCADLSYSIVSGKNAYVSLLNETTDLFLYQKLFGIESRGKFVVDNDFVFREPTVLFFLNEFLKHNLNSVQVCPKVFKIIAQLKSTNSTYVFRCLLLSLKSNIEHVFDFFTSMYAGISLIDFKTALDTINSTELFLSGRALSSDIQNLFSLMFCAAAEFSCASLVRKVCDLVYCVTNKSFTFFYYRTSPLILAIRRGDFYIVNHLLSTGGSDHLKNKNALEECVKESYRSSKYTVSCKLSVLKLLLEQFPECLTENSTILLENELDMSLVKCLIDAGYDINTRTAKNKNVAHKTAKYLSAEEYDEMVRIITSKTKTNLFKQKSHNGKFPLHVALTRMDLLTETLQFLSASWNVSFNNTSWKQPQTEFGVAIQSGRSIRVLTDIHSLGGSLTNCTYLNLAGAVVLAIDSNNIETVKWLISNGEKINGQIFLRCTTPFHEAVWEGNDEMVKFLAQNGANLNSLQMPRQELLYEPSCYQYCCVPWFVPLQTATHSPYPLKESTIQSLRNAGARDSTVIPCYCSPFWWIFCCPCMCKVMCCCLLEGKMEFCHEFGPDFCREGCPPFWDPDYWKN